MICVPITASTMESALQEIREAEKVADILELRLDCLEDHDLVRILSARKKPIIVTNRKREEGGKFSGSESDRLALLEEAILQGADYVDVEWSCGRKILNRFRDLTLGTKTRIITSWHDFKQTPGNLTELYTAIRTAGTDIIKIVTQANSINDNLKIFDLISQAEEDEQDIIAFCMGSYGEISRILSPLLGGFLTFGALQEGKESAPGQIEARLMRDVYRIPNLMDTEFHLYGLVGNPVNKSQGFRIHNQAFKYLGVDNLYVNFLVEDLASFIQDFKGYICGLSITMPHKQEIMKYLNQVDPLAQRIGAVNTIVKKSGRLIGYNTDCTGAIQAIEQVMPISNKKVILLGAGGVAKAIGYGIVDRGGHLTILNRTISKAQELARELGAEAGGLAGLEGVEADLLINATSVGMSPKGDETPVPESVLKPGLVVFDTVYNPSQTRLLQEAGSKGCRLISGQEMFLRQAAAQVSLWTGQDVPIDIIRSALG